ncbi:hypothetical protein JXA70_08730 [candidate division KSB1 bacterium]|nr:hypothetical protein [candidate division KSB1 bacterium]
MNLKNNHILLLAVFLAALVYCENPFATRAPEPPKRSQSNWIQPTSPSYVMYNLKNAMQEKNKSNYLRCLADTSVSSKEFIFSPEPAVANAHPGLFDRWGKEAETNYLNQLYSYLPKDSLTDVTFNRLKETAFQDSVILIQEYAIAMQDPCKQEFCTRNMRGQAEFRLVRSDDDFWYIFRWSDAATSDSLTWSDLKARFGK